MESQAICSVEEIDPATRSWLRRLFGRELLANQRIMFKVLDVPEHEPTAGTKQAWATIERLLDKAAANLKDVSEQDFDATLDESMAAARPRKVR